MDADTQITVGTVQTDWFSCQVCDSVTLSFLTHGLCHICQSFIEQSVVFPFALLPSSVSFGTEGWSLFGGRRWCGWFSLIGGSKAHRVSVSNYYLGNSSKCIHAFVCIRFNHAIGINFTYLQ